MNINKLNVKLIEKNITKIELAAKTGLTTQAINGMLRRNDCRVSDLEKISQVLGVSLFYWWEGDEGCLVKEPATPYGPKAENELLKAQLKDKEKLIARLEKELSRYEDKT